MEIWIEEVELGFNSGHLSVVVEHKTSNMLEEEFWESFKLFFGGPTDVIPLE